VRFIIVALAALALAGCVTPIFDAESGQVGITVEPLVGQSRFLESERAAKEYGDRLAQALAELATKVGEAEIAMAAKAAEAERRLQQDKFDLEDIYGSEWLYIILGGLGLGEFTRRKRKQWKAELPEDYEDVSEDYEE